MTLLDPISKLDHFEQCW